MNPRTDERRDPVEVIRHARNYLKRTRGERSFEQSLAGKLLNEAERKAAKCIDHLLNDKMRAIGAHCPCDFHEREWQATEFLKPPKTGPRRRDGKALATGEENDE